jgi:hypothetical protein
VTNSITLPWWLFWPLVLGSQVLAFWRILDSLREIRRIRAARASRREG